MRAPQQLIVGAAVVFATLAVGANVYASTRGVEQRAQQLALEIPVASVLDRGVFDDPSVDHPSRDADREDDGCVSSDGCPDVSVRAIGGDDGTATHPENHGQIVSEYAQHIGWYSEVLGPPGLLVRDFARSDDGKDDDKQPPGLNKDDDKQPPGLNKDDSDDEDKNKDKDDADKDKDDD